MEQAAPAEGRCLEDIQQGIRLGTICIENNDKREAPAIQLPLFGDSARLRCIARDMAGVGSSADPL